MSDNNKKLTPFSESTSKIPSLGTSKITKEKFNESAKSIKTSNKKKDK
ncbi:hypothetical protein J18TS1_27550 [Oceanobacillus oncorhynchi subsp. incaldanensis]|nr:hypothetical protein [Oceanobacillus oncorhynchi]GIO19655.1 hypothetical protein J18TS1_27550 [Oceanobacillus oncorhynchi subsp. incaldanensis]